MNRRTLKKKCKAAVRELVAKHGYQAAAFVPSDGDDTMDAPSTMERRFVEYVFFDHAFFTPLKGTPLYSYRCSHEYDEWDIMLPTDVLADIHHWEKMSPDDWAALDQEVSP